jgi:hypothetical protein
MLSRQIFNQELRTLVNEVMDVRLVHLRGGDTVDITDRVFLEIENDKIFMKQYRALVEERSIRSVNQSIGRYIKVHWGLNNYGPCTNPKSKLIKSYTKH